MTETPAGSTGEGVVGDSRSPKRRAADARYAGTAMRRYSQLGATSNSPWLRGEKSILEYLGPASPAHPPLGANVQQHGWGGGLGWDRLRTPEAMAAPIRFRSRARKAGHILDFHRPDLFGTLILVSDRAAALLREFDADAMDTYPVEITLATGEVLPQGSYHLFDVTRDIPAVDLEASGWRWEPGWKGGPLVLIRQRPTNPDEPDIPIYILRDKALPESVHLFRDRRFIRGGPIWVSEAVREAMIARGIYGADFHWGDGYWHTLTLRPARFQGRM